VGPDTRLRTIWCNAVATVRIGRSVGDYFFIDLKSGNLYDRSVMEKLLRELLREKGDRGGQVFSVSSETTALEAARKMRRNRVGSLLVIDGKQLKGIFTERDVLNKVVAEALDPAEVPVSEIMTRNVIVIGPKLTVREAMQIVTEKRLRHLPVVQGSRLLGMLSGGDLTRSIVEESESFIETLYEYMHGTYPG